MEQPATFRFSNEALKEAKQRILLWQLSFPVMLALFMLASPLTGSTLFSKLIAFMIVLILMEGLLIIVPAITFQKMKEWTLTLSFERFQMMSGVFLLLCATAMALVLLFFSNS